MAEIYTAADELILAFYREATTFGNGPVDDGSDWATEIAGAGAFAIRARSADPAAFRQGFLESPDLRKRFTDSYDPIKGLRSDQDFSFQISLYGSEAETAAASQVAQTGLGELLTNALGGGARGNTTAVAAAPTNDTTFDVDAGTNLAAGQCCFIADAGDSERLFMRQFKTVSGTSVTTDIDFGGFNIAENDEVHAANTFYIDTDALSRGGTGYDTYSILVCRNGQCWEATACKIKLDSIVFERGAVPVCNFTAMLGHVRPFNDGAPAEPAVTDCDGGEGLAWGIDSFLHIQTFGTVTEALRSAETITFTPGIEIQRIPRSTNEGVRPEGLAGYNVTSATPTLEANVIMDGDYQDDWDTTSKNVVSVYQVGPPGTACGVVMPRAVLKEPPTAVNLDGGTKQYTLMWQGRENTVTTNALTRSPAAIAIG